MTYKTGDYYKDWKKLKPLPLLPAKDHNPPLKVGELFVVVDSDNDKYQCENGTIVRFIKDDGMNNPYFTGKNREVSYSTCRLALLTKQETKKQKS